MYKYMLFNLFSHRFVQFSPLPLYRKYCNNHPIPTITTLSHQPSILVTGAGGYVGTELVTQLLEQGKHVTATFREIDNARKMDYFLTLQNTFPHQLDIYEYNMKYSLTSIENPHKIRQVI